MIRFRTLLSCTLLAATVSAPAAVDLFGWLDDELLQRIRISGRQSFGLHFHDVQGDRGTFNQLNYSGRGGNRFTDERDVLISGSNVLGVFNFEVELNNNRFGRPIDRRMSLNYDRRWLKVDAGDISASLLNTNQLISFRRSMSGAQVETRFGKLKLKGVYTRSRSAARTITINGNNSQGPYYIQGSRIVDGSLHVRVDGEEMRLGEDYTANLETGTIMFTNRVIPPTSVIVVTYETRGLNQSRGDVIGGGVLYEFQPGVTVGYANIEQRPKSSAGLSQTTEEFQGYGPPNTPYYLLQPPMRERQIIVTVDNVLQTEGVDYYFDLNNPLVFYFTRFMPATSVIRVTYTPRPDPGTFGNGRRQLQGVDLQWNIGKNGSLNVSAAESRLWTPLGVERGRAQAAAFRYRWDRLEFRTNWRHIPGTFVSVESAGFRRNESGTDATLNYHAGRGLNFSLAGSSLRIGTPVFEGGGIRTVNGTSRDIRLNANYEPKAGESLFLTVSQFKGRFQGEPNSNRGLTGGYRHTRGRWSAEFDLGANHVTSPKLGKGGLIETVDTSLAGARIGTTYRASDKLSISSRIGYNAIRSDGKQSSGRDLSLSANYDPSESLHLDLTLADTHSGAITGLNGYSGGYGYGYGGNGFSGGTFGFGGIAGATRAKVAQLHARWLPWSELSLDATLLKSVSEGDNLTNSRMEGATVSADWSPNPDTSLHVGLSRQNVSFLQAPGASQTNMLDIFGRRDFGRWSVTANFNSTIFGGSGLTGFNQNLASYGANLNYRVAKKQRAFIEFSQGNTAGYLADQLTYLGAGYAYEILPGVHLVAGYKLRDKRNIGDKHAENSYRSSGFDLELRIDFGNTRNSGIAGGHGSNGRRP